MVENLNDGRDGKDAFDREITCRECGKNQRYRKPVGVSGRPPQKCGKHRKNWNPHVPESHRWQPVGDPK